MIARRRHQRLGCTHMSCSISLSGIVRTFFCHIACPIHHLHARGRHRIGPRVCHHHTRPRSVNRSVPGGFLIQHLERPRIGDVLLQHAPLSRKFVLTRARATRSRLPAASNPGFASIDRWYFAELFFPVNHGGLVGAGNPFAWKRGTPGYPPHGTSSSPSLLGHPKENN